jgi:hypothetical protein
MSEKGFTTKNTKREKTKSTRQNRPAPGIGFHAETQEHWLLKLEKAHHAFWNYRSWFDDAIERAAAFFLRVANHE